MPTKPEVERILRSLDYNGFLAVAQKLRVSRDQPLNKNLTDREWMEYQTDRWLQAYDGNEQFKKLLLRALNLPIDEESQLHMQAAATDAAVRSATTAEKALEAVLISADAAQRSANAAEKSETHARSSTKAAWLTVLLTLIAVTAAVVALLKSFHIIGD